jgi:hypothetical protein
MIGALIPYREGRVGWGSHVLTALNWGLLFHHGRYDWPSKSWRRGDETMGSIWTEATNWEVGKKSGASQTALDTEETTLDQVPKDFHLKITKLWLKYDSKEFPCQNWQKIFKYRCHTGNAESRSKKGQKYIHSL